MSAALLVAVPQASTILSGTRQEVKKHLAVIKASYSSDNTDVYELFVQKRKLKEQRTLNNRGLRMTIHDDRDQPVKEDTSHS